VPVVVRAIDLFTAFGQVIVILTGEKYLQLCASPPGDLLLSMGPARWSGQSGKELVLAGSVMHAEMERQATEVGRQISGELLERRF